MPSSNSSLRARSKAPSVLRAVLDGPVGRHAEALLVEPAVGVAQRVGGRLVRAGEPRAEHHARRPAGEGEGDVARVAHAAVGPDVLAEPAGLVGALDHGGELRAPDAGHHPRRAHRTRADTDLDDVGAGLDQLAGAVGGDDVAGDDRDVGGDGAHLLDRPQRAGLVAVGRVDHEHVDAHLDERLGLGGGIAVDADGDGDHQPAVGVDRRLVDRGAQRALAGDEAEQAAVGVDDRRHRAAVASTAGRTPLGRRCRRAR